MIHRTGKYLKLHVFHRVHWTWHTLTQVSLNTGYAEHLAFCHIGVADVVWEGTKVFAGGPFKRNKTVDMMVNRVNKIFLPPAKEVWGKVIFSEACVKNSVHGGLPQCILGFHPPGPDPPGTRHPPGPVTPLGPGTPLSRACWEIRSTSGRYASYWNAILSLTICAFVSGCSRGAMVTVTAFS